MASILKRNNSYHIMVSIGYDSNGKQLRKTMNWKPEEGMTEKQIEKAVNEQAVLFEKKVLSGQVLDSNITFAQFVERWERDYAEPNLAPKTLTRYKSMLKRILPEIGHYKLSKLQPNHLIELYSNMGNDINKRGISFLPTDKFFQIINELKLTRDWISNRTGLHINTVYNVFRKIPVAQGSAERISEFLEEPFDDIFVTSKPITVLSNKTIKHHHRLISCILNQAVFWQVIPSNIATRVKPPKVDRTEAKFLDEKETAKLLELLKREPYQNSVMIKMFIYSGLRRGEMCGL